MYLAMTHFAQVISDFGLLFVIQTFIFDTQDPNRCTDDIDVLFGVQKCTRLKLNKIDG